MAKKKYQHKCTQCFRRGIDKTWESDLKRPEACPRCKRYDWDSPIDDSSPADINTCPKCDIALVRNEEDDGYISIKPVYSLECPTCGMTDDDVIEEILTAQNEK
jgi:rubrerythrin|tara:strand:- start:4345 stop:4656 length:312 start_codon:yes stop_codon:yes gene_type:complete